MKKSWIFVLLSILIWKFIFVGGIQYLLNGDYYPLEYLKDSLGVTVLYVIFSVIYSALKRQHN